MIFCYSRGPLVIEGESLIIFYLFLSSLILECGAKTNCYD